MEQQTMREVIAKRWAGGAYDDEPVTSFDELISVGVDPQEAFTLCYNYSQRNSDVFNILADKAAVDAELRALGL